MEAKAQDKAQDKRSIGLFDICVVPPLLGVVVYGCTLGGGGVWRIVLTLGAALTAFMACVVVMATSWDTNRKAGLEKPDLPRGRYIFFLAATVVLAAAILGDSGVPGIAHDVLGYIGLAIVALLIFGEANPTKPAQAGASVPASPQVTETREQRLSRYTEEVLRSMAAAPDPEHEANMVGLTPAERGAIEVDAARKVAEVRLAAEESVHSATPEERAALLADGQRRRLTFVPCPGCGTSNEPDARVCKVCEAAMPDRYRGPTITVRGCDYIGGDAALDERMPGLEVQFSEHGAMLVGVPEQIVITRRAWPQIVTVEAEGPEEVHRRVTATRILLLGIFAWAVKKQERVAYLILETTDAQMIFEVKGVTPYELVAEISPVKKWLESQRIPVPAASAQPEASYGHIDALMKLAQLRDSGTLTEQEFQTEKMRVLGQPS